eukprot:CAMPEP_0117421832 /NCGR_PEP_ID=MMETSP0758-20121206/2808_1 /TAXON_ID=63605 /ORGANISM="Percolomonas cosmopolitus, Strain AE-1 (ATCC 50343)" /LENGTH=677 /DNA_ID=CAMNT_0005204119 /DNA_START=266 /DNA_END=2299 /DNA_ORIENTATION=-
MTKSSLYAAVSIGITPQELLNTLEKLSKIDISEETREFVIESTANYGKLRMVLENNKFYVESQDLKQLQKLCNRPSLQFCFEVPKRSEKGYDSQTGFLVRKEFVKQNRELENLGKAIDDLEQGTFEEEVEDDDAIQEKEQQHFNSTVEQRMEDDDDEGTRVNIYRREIVAAKREKVSKECNEQDMTMMEEFDFHNSSLPTLQIALKPTTKLRDYQSKSLSKMFSNKRARSGIIILPCGAGKTLVGVAAAATIRKSVIIITINTTSVNQWEDQIRAWTRFKKEEVPIIKLTSQNKSDLPHKDQACIVITTYSMAQRSNKGGVTEGAKIMFSIQQREWGLMLLDEVHVAPSDQFRTIVGKIKAHCKVGLTATLVREDDKVMDLYYLIGPKHYEANWMDLAAKNHLASVKCFEIWCPMSCEFYRRYMNASSASLKSRYYVLNPSKFRACEYLIKYHLEFGAKILVFMNHIESLRIYEKRLGYKAIYGAVKDRDREEILDQFRNPNSGVNVIFLSSVGDMGIDIPNANVLIQVSSHFGSRRQEAQRLGRILRKKDTTFGGDNSAYFYTLVSQDTSEMAYTHKRQRFLISQGYSFTVCDNFNETLLEEMQKNPVNGRIKKAPKTREDEEILLNQVEGHSLEPVLNKPKRKHKSLSKMSGDSNPKIMNMLRRHQEKQFKNSFR